MRLRPPIANDLLQGSKRLSILLLPVEKRLDPKRFPLDLTPQQPFTQVADGEIDTFSIPERSKATVLQINPSDQVQIRMSVFEHPFSKLTTRVRLPLAHQVWTSIWIPRSMASSMAKLVFPTPCGPTSNSACGTLPCATASIKCDFAVWCPKMRSIPLSVSSAGTLNPS